MGQAPSAEADIQHADLACAFDKDLDPPCLELVEAALEWTKDAWLAFERDPTAMVRASAVDLLAPQRASAKDKLRVLLRSPRVDEYTVGGHHVRLHCDAGGPPTTARDIACHGT